MSLRRYSRTPVINGGKSYGTSYLAPIIRQAIKNGEILCEEIILRHKERLDTLSAKYYGDGSLWWVLAIASDIGFAPQVPEGTIIKVVPIEFITRYLG